MTSILRSFMPVSASKVDDHDEYSVEYSFALEYSGPPVGYDIPQVVPVDVNRIPTAAVVSKASMSNNLSLPIIQPIVKSDRSSKGLAKRSKVGPEAAEFEGSDRILPRKLVVDANDQEGAAVDGSENGDACAVPRVSDGTGSSDTLGFSDSHNDSNEISESSDIEDLNDENSSHAQHANPQLEDRSLSSSASSSEIATCEEVEDCLDETHRGSRTPVVTFRDPQTSEITSEDGSLDELDNAVERPVARSDVKRGLCYRCFKGNRFTEKEVCLVCGAKFCSSCLLRAMGSMPEGRKCITCISHMIDESKRGSLGKPSRMLKKLLTDGELKQIMRNEISCEANQLPPRLVSVNGRPLSLQELSMLQNCRNPPKKLKPGRYWYDKQSGFWGKEGQQPCQIISPRLDVGSQIERNASNGNTNVLINGREITKKELWMLQMAGIHCEGRPHYWLSPDGSYQEEGQKNVMGKLWDKSGIKLICAALSLPIPPESCNGEVEKDADKVCSEGLDQKADNKLLLVGCDQSGTSTIFKQAKILYDVPFSGDDRQNIKFMIQTNLYRYIGILLEGREWFEEDCLLELRRQHLSQPGPSAYAEQIEEKNAYSISPRLKAFSDWLLQVMMSGNLEAIFPAATREYATLIEDLVKDSGFQATYSRRNELPMLPRVANYFLDRAVEISRVDYEPSDMDILYAEGFTSSNGVTSMEFSFPMSSQDGYMEPTDQSDPAMSYRYQLIRVHASSLGENCKWLGMFEDVDLVLFCVSLTDYDEYYVNSDGACINKMLASKNLMENVVTHPSFAQKSFLLMLNKFDLLEEKLERVPLSQCEWFQDFYPLVSLHPQSRHGNSTPSLAQRAFHYIGAKFKRLFDSLTERKLYVSPVTGLESDSVDEALKYAREILKWEQEKPTVSVNDWSSGSMEASTSS
ncbi:extra-large guanine nucleotide-binding protein 1-like isoform X1 [Coffea arabica]|uniref:Extra-large guanine nucleotide-binding protein 1-like isoform X1 n=1 Tax=Coffea arabica TaxID=13443 RepID=A0A6P6WBJ3_COFAR